MTIAFVDSGEQQPILVGGGDSDDEIFDDGDGRGGVDSMRELEMAGITTGGRGSVAAASNGRTPHAGKNGPAAATSHHNGLGNGAHPDGAVPIPLSRRERSSGPSREHSSSPIKPKRRGKAATAAAGMGMYSRVTGDGPDPDRWDGGTFEDNPGGREYQEGDSLRESREGGGGFGNGNGLGRTGEVEVEGQMETGWGRSSWDGDSHSSGDNDAGAGSELVEPA